jgi:hypothetical protein
VPPARSGMVIYRSIRRSRWLAIVWLSVWLVAIVAALTWTAVAAPAQARWLLAGTAVLVGGGMILVGLGSLLEQWRCRLEIDGPCIRSFGVCSRREMSLSEVVEAQWRTPTVLLLTDKTKRISINFRCLDSDDALDLIRYFRLNLPARVQHGWERFCDANLVRGNPDREPCPDSERVIMLRRRVDVWCLIAFGISLPMCATAWWVTGEPGTLVGILGIPLLGAILHFLLPIRQIVKKSQPTSPALRRLLLASVAWCATCVAAMVALASLGDDIGPLPVLGMLILTMLVYVTGMVPIGNLLERERRRLYAPIERDAVAEWEATETKAGRD